MAWVKLDDGFYRHDKARAVGKDGRALFIASLCYVASQRSDRAFISNGHLPIVAAEADVRPSVAKRLVEAGLWETAVDGYIVHDYFEYQPTPDEVEDRRRKRAEAGARGGKAAAANRAKRQADATASAVALATAKPKQPAKQPASKRDTPLPVTPREPSTKVPPAEASPSAEDARNLVSAFWEASNPKPVVKFIALTKLVEQFLDAGWTQQQVMRGLRQTRAFTKDAIEFTLRQNAEAPRQSKSDQAVENLQGWLDKGAPTPFAIGQGGSA